MTSSKVNPMRDMGISDKNDRNPNRTLLTPELLPAKTKDGATKIRIRGGTIIHLVKMLSHSDKELLLLLHNHFGHAGYTINQVPYLKLTETNMLLTLYHDELAFSNTQKADIKRIAYILKFGKRPNAKVLKAMYSEVQKDKSFII